MNRVAQWMGRSLAHYLNKTTQAPYPYWPVNLSTLESILRPADLVLVEGRARISTAIKYLTQSTWSHVAMFVGGYAGQTLNGRTDILIEADVEKGVRLLPLDDLKGFHLRVCRPVGLSDADAHRVVNFAMARLGQQYDLKNVFDLARYLLPFPLPSAWRRRALALGSGDPSRAICSTLLAEAFLSIPFPILPDISNQPQGVSCHAAVREIYHIRNHRLFTPRDFDVSPYFEVIKPTIARGFDYRQIHWGEEPVENRDSTAPLE